MTFIRTACPHDCPSTCALEVERLDPYTIGKVHGDPANTYTAGVICAKVARYTERVHHPDRLAKPLKRVGCKAGPGGRNRFEECSWDEALDLVAQAFARAAELHDPTTVWPYFFAGTMGLVQRDCIHRLRHVMGYSHEDETICVTIAQMGWRAGHGAIRGADPREMAESDLIVIWGCNAVSTQVNVMTHVTRARKERGAKVVCIDPYRNGTAEAADIHLAVRPGTDGALACAVMHVLFKEGYADRAYMARYADCPERLEKHLETRTPEWASQITGLPVEDIVAFARLYGATKRSFVRAGYGFTRQRNGAVNMHAATCLPVVTGAWQHRGGGALFGNAGLYTAVLDQTLIKGLDRFDPTIRALDMCQIGRILLNEPDSLLGGPPVTALFIQNINPLAVVPELAKVRDGFAREDLFVCVHEQFMTETAAVADVVLPATMFLEHDDVYRGGGHTYLLLAPKVIEPYGECRPNNWVVNQLLKRLGAQHPALDMTDWELIDDMLRRSGLPGADEAYAQGGIDFTKDFATMHFLNGFTTPDKRFHFAPDWKALGKEYHGLPALPDHYAVIEEATAEHPFRLVAAPARNFLNTSFTEMPTSRKREGRPTVFIHPRDLTALGLREGDRVRLGNQRASVVVHAKAFDGLQPGVVVVESIWPNAYFEEKLGLNALIGADRAPPNGGGAFHDTAVWIRAA
jgi:anaerobic selenocysteine-containing dehydrogenase